MATWVAHLMIADEVIKQMSFLSRHEFYVGNIAPDCNVKKCTMCRNIYEPAKVERNKFRWYTKQVYLCLSFCNLLQNQKDKCLKNGLK